MAIRILLTGGGSGGHVYPLWAVAESLKRKLPEVDLQYLGPSDEFSAILAEKGIPTHSILSSKLRRYAAGILENLVDVPRFFIAFFQALLKIFWLMPDAVFSKGGPGAFATVLAARFYRIPVVIHESDSIPGLTNIFCRPFAKYIAISFPDAQRYFPAKKTFLTGQPIRKELFENVPRQDIAKQELHFDPNKPLILILGSSQGSTRINEFIAVNLKDILKIGQVLHQTGKANFAATKEISQITLRQLPADLAAETRYLPVPFLFEDMKTALSAADVVISRASSTIMEIAGFGKPAILIPLKESANDHQRENAYVFAKAGGGTVIEEPNLLPTIFLNELKKIVEHTETREKMGLASGAFFKPDGADNVADLVLSVIKQ
ncbi:MAG TPA: UDP-N-acetylglucosamine--N-acetylmuramyl-(pentapeptide) pyrophosphoryl-undecaprenol N-acetylglucosamine transferase [Candidatus Paceibacterota bacterium]